MMGTAHWCKCSQVTQCGIYVHPSSQVQDALNTLVNSMTKFDEATGSSSLLFFKSLHHDGVFTSLTLKEQNDR